MRQSTRDILDRIADGLEAFLHGYIIDGIEIMLSDHAGKRPRRSSRTITRRQRRKAQVVYKHIYKAVPVIVRVKEGHDI